MKKIALEEHYGTAELMQLRSDWFKRDNMPMNLPPEALKRITFLIGDVEQRIAEMDANEIAWQILLPASNGIEGISDGREALEASRRHNDNVAEVVARYPNRFKAYAAIPMQAPELAAREIERCMEIDAFVGAWLSGYVHNTGFIDDHKFNPIFEQGEKSGAIFYIHPTETPLAFSRIYENCPGLVGPPWSWGVDTGTYVLRMILNGVFDRYPKTQLIMAHMGEMLPYVVWRVQNRLERENKLGGLKKSVIDYFRENISITISGVLQQSALRCALDSFGADRVMFAIDYPFEPMGPTCDFIEQADISEEERRAVCYENAARLFRIEA